MNCKRCGRVLPNKGLICTSCGAVMEEEQIKRQKELIKMQNPNNKIEMVTERYGKKLLYEKRTEEKMKNKSLFLFFLLFIIIVFIGMIVYFL